MELSARQAGKLRQSWAQLLTQRYALHRFFHRTLHREEKFINSILEFNSTIRNSCWSRYMLLGTHCICMDWRVYHELEPAYYHLRCRKISLCLLVHLAEETASHCALDRLPFLDMSMKMRKHVSHRVITTTTTNTLLASNLWNVLSFSNQNQKQWELQTPRRIQSDRTGILIFRSHWKFVRCLKSIVTPMFINFTSYDNLFTSISKYLYRASGFHEFNWMHKIYHYAYAHEHKHNTTNRAYTKIHRLFP